MGKGKKGARRAAAVAAVDGDAVPPTPASVEAAPNGGGAVAPADEARPGSSLDGEREVLRAALAGPPRDAVGELRAESSKLRAEVVELVKQLEATEASVRGVESQKAELEARFDGFKKDSERYRLEVDVKIKEKSKRIKALKSRGVQISARLSNLKEDLLAAMARHREFESYLDWVDLLVTGREVADELRADIADLNKQHSVVVSELLCHKSEIDEFAKLKEAAAAEYDAEKKRMEAELEKLRMEVDSIQAERDAAAGMAREKDAEAAKLSVMIGMQYKRKGKERSDRKSTHPEGKKRSREELG